MRAVPADRVTHADLNLIGRTLTREETLPKGFRELLGAAATAAAAAAAKVVPSISRLLVAFWRRCGSSSSEMAFHLLARVHVYTAASSFPTPPFITR